MCENVKVLECVYQFMDIKSLEENGLMNNNAFPNLFLWCVESCYRYE